MLLRPDQLTAVLLCFRKTGRRPRCMRTMSTSVIQAAAIWQWGWWLVNAWAFYNKAVVSTLQIHCHGHVAHGTSRLYHSVSVSTSSPWCVNHVETSTSWYNLYWISCRLECLYNIIVPVHVQSIEGSCGHSYSCNALWSCNYYLLDVLVEGVVHNIGTLPHRKYSQRWWMRTRGNLQ